MYLSVSSLLLALFLAAPASAGPHQSRLQPSVAVTPVRIRAGASAQGPVPLGGQEWDERRIALPLVGSGMAYVPRTPTPHVVLFVSGEGGWKADVIEMARRIAARQAIVIGISYPALKRTAARE